MPAHAIPADLVFEQALWVNRATSWLLQTAVQTSPTWLPSTDTMPSLNCSHPDPLTTTSPTLLLLVQHHFLAEPWLRSNKTAELIVHTQPMLERCLEHYMKSWFSQTKGTESMSPLVAGLGDLERSLARLNAAGVGGGMGRDALQVVLYEDNAKRRVAAMIAGLRGLQALNAAVKGFQSVLHDDNATGSLLQQLLTPGRGFPELDGPLEALERATDWQEAASSGRAIPRPVSRCCLCVCVCVCV